jgi:hypothetical protein
MRARKTNEIDFKTIAVATLFHDLLRHHAGKGSVPSVWRGQSFKAERSARDSS